MVLPILCVHSGYRRGATIALLWSAITDCMGKHRYRYLIGCASMSMADDGGVAASIYWILSEANLAPVE